MSSDCGASCAKFSISFKIYSIISDADNYSNEEKRASIRLYEN